MKNKKWLIMLAVGIAVSLTGYGLYSYYRPHFATRYEDAGGWMYSCTKPIQVKDQGVTYGNGQPSLTPVDETEAAKYCSPSGIE